MTLYEIDKAILEAVDSETGEVIDPEKLDALQMERDAKVEAVALWYKNLRAEEAAIKAEKNALAEREKKAAKKADDLEEWLSNALGGQAFSTAKCAVSFRKSERVEILNEKEIPAWLFSQTVTVSPNKTEIKKLLKSGESVAGCLLVERQNPQIK